MKNFLKKLWENWLYPIKRNEKGNEVVFGIIITLIVFVVVGFALWGMPKYKIYRLEMSGKAELAEADWNRQIQIKEAEANLESEKLNAQSEVERAKGMAEAIKIENGQLTSLYIDYLWVRHNKFNDKTTIYVPTEAGLPILEARNK